MTTWTSTELDRIAGAEELQFASMRRDGTLRDRVTIWVVRVGDDLYVRAVRGRAGWFRGTQTRHKGRIWAGGVEKDVNFVIEDDPETQRRIDAAYRAKYGHYPPRYVDPVLTPEALDATLKLVPRSPDA